MKKSLLYASVLTLFFISCKTKKSTSTEPAEVKKDKGTVIAASELYSRSCGSCHDLPEPTKYDSAQWKPILKDMQKRAHLSDQSIANIYEYLISQK